MHDHPVDADPVGLLLAMTQVRVGLRAGRMGVLATSRRAAGLVDVTSNRAEGLLVGTTIGA
jgi:hypothetical protein